MIRIALVVLLVACQTERAPRFRGAGRTTPRDGGTLHLASHERIQTLDPAIQYDEVSLLAMHALFDTLVDYEPTSTRLIPRLAERWDISPDGLVYTFTLRPNVTYSDGVAVRAADIELSLERARTMPDSPYSSFVADIVDIDVRSERELAIHLRARNAAFIYVMTMPFTTPQRADHIAAAGPQLRRSPLGTGPFVLEEWSEGERAVFRRNPRYWDPTRAHLDRIEMLELVPPDTQFLMFERGDLDMIYKLAAPDLVWLLEQPGWQPYIVRTPGLNAFGARMDTTKKPFDDRRVRQALNYALNKQHSVKLLTGGAVEAHGILPPGIAGRDDALAPYPHDPAKARALLAEAGYPNGFDVDFVVMNDEEAEKLAASMQADFAEVGVRLHISPVSFVAWMSAIGEANGPSFVKATWLGDFPDPSAFLDAKFHSRGINDDYATNDSRYANPTFDALLDAARGELDEAARTTLYQRAERILHDDAPWVWDYHQFLTLVTQPYVRGFSLHPIWLQDFTSAWLDVDDRGQRVPR